MRRIAAFLASYTLTFAVGVASTIEVEVEHRGTSCDPDASISSLTGELAAPNPETRACAAHALGLRGGAATPAIPALMETLTDLDIGKNKTRQALRVYPGNLWTFRTPRLRGVEIRATSTTLTDLTSHFHADDDMDPVHQFRNTFRELPYRIVAGGLNDYPAFNVTHSAAEDLELIGGDELYHIPDRTGLYRSFEGDFAVLAAALQTRDESTGEVTAKEYRTLVTTSPGVEAAWALARIGGPEVLDALLAAIAPDEKGRLTAKTWFPRRMAIRSLGHLRDEKAIEALTFVLRNDKEPLNRGFAVMALAEIGGEQVIEPLIGALKDRVPQRRKLARRELVALTGMDHGKNQQAWLDWWHSGDADR